MRRFLTCGLFLLPLAMFLSCGSESVVEPEELEPPTNLTVTDIASTGGQVSLEWDGAVGDYVGYRIYRHTQSLQSLDDTEELAPYMIQEVGAATQSATVDLGDSYTYYYVHVRAYTEEDDLSRASNEVLTIARPQGENAVIYEFDAPPPNASGYDLSQGEEVSMGTDQADRYDRVDMFVGYAAGTTGGGDLYLWNPKTASTNYQNTAGFAGMASTFTELTRIPDGTTFSDHVALSEGDVIAVRVTDENAITNYAKLEIVSIAGAEPTRTITFMWAYQPEPDHRELVPQP